MIVVTYPAIHLVIVTTFANPFFFESPSGRWAFTDREQLLPALADLLGQRGRRLLVFGRRRMGKTSLVQHAAAKAGHVFLYADLSTAASLNEFAAKLLAAAPKESDTRLASILGLARKHLKSFAIAAGKLTLSAELRTEAAEQSLEQVLNYLNARAGLDDTPWTVCLDEFQDIRTIGGDRAEWKLRGLIQSHRHLNYVFTGSDHRLVAWMTEPSAAFFKQLHQMEVGPIEAGHLARWIERRAITGGVSAFPYGESIVALAGPCTGDVVRLAKIAFDLVAAGRTKEVVPTAFDAIALVELNSEFQARWHGCPLTHRAVLRALSAGLPPTAAKTLRQFGLSSASTAQKAVESLIERQILARDAGALIFDNPFFRRWVSFNGA